MTLFELYMLFIFIPGLGSVLCSVGGISLVVYGIMFFWVSVYGFLEDDMTYLKKLTKYKLIPILLIVFVVIGSVLPSQKNMFLLVGGYATTNNKELAKVPDNVLKAMNHYLEQVTKVDEKKPEKK